MARALCLVVLLYLASTTSAYTVTFQEDSHLLGTSPCTYGPSYWCHNITLASSCASVKHCISHYWSTAPQLPPDNDDVCTICKEMVKEARDQLLSNETQSELKQVLDGSCALIPLPPIATECKSLMDNFLPELVDALASRMDPQLVCKVSGLCNSRRIDVMLEGQTDKISCTTCTTQISHLLTYLNSTDGLQDLLLEQCGYLGSYSDACRLAVLEDFKEIQTAIRKSDATEFCQLISICNESATADTTTTTEIAISDPDLACSFCTQLITHLRDFLVLNTTREEFNQVIDNMCKIVGDKHEKECRDFVAQYGGEIYQLLVDDLDAQSFCERVGVCNSTLIGEGNFPIWTVIQPSTNELQELTKGEKMTSDELNSNEPCQLCTLISAALQSYLDSPSTTHSIETFLTQVCDKHLPKEMASQCDEFVEEYGDEVINLIGEEMSPSELCPFLKLCPKPKPVKDVLPTCALCEFIVTKLINLIGKNKTKESIESATQRVCHVLPSRYVTECSDFMKNYGDQVIEMILIEGSSHEICAALHLCLFKPNPTTVVVEPSFPERSNDNPRCVLCEYVISTLAARIKDNATEAEIKEELNLICTRLPKTITKSCLNFIKDYGDLVLSFLVQEMDPEVICGELGLCKKQLLGSGGELHMSSCQLCQMVQDYFRVKSGDSTFLSDPVGEGTTRLCPRLKGAEDECTTLIEDYGLYLLQLITTSTSQQDGCRVVGIC